MHYSRKMDFFHCNRCFIQPGSHTNKTFWLTNCGHSFCDDCTDTGDSICRLCNNACKYLALNHDVPLTRNQVRMNDLDDNLSEADTELMDSSVEEVVPLGNTINYNHPTDEQGNVIESPSGDDSNISIILMPDDVKSYFLDAIKELKKIIRIMLVQNKHSKIYMEEYVPKLEEKYVSAKLTIEKRCIEIETLKTTLKEKNTEVISLHKVIRKLESEIEDLKKQFSRVYQTPVNVLPVIPDTPKSFTRSLTPRESPLQNILRTPRTPRSNQTFSMTINTSPESSEDERWAPSTPRRGISLSQKSFHSPAPHFKVRDRFF